MTKREKVSRHIQSAATLINYLDLGKTNKRCLEFCSEGYHLLGTLSSVVTCKAQQTSKTVELT